MIQVAKVAAEAISAIIATAVDVRQSRHLLSGLIGLVMISGCKMGSSQPTSDVETQATSLVFSANGQSLDTITISFESSVRLEWSAQGASGCKAEGDWSGTKSLQGSESISNVRVSKAYTLVCQGTPNVRKTISVAIDPKTVQRKKLEFTGIGNVGLGDPSMAKDPNSSRIYMSYTSVESVAGMSSITANTRIAHSDDGGETWVDDGILNVAKEEASKGATAIYEVSKLYVDPWATDPNKRWHIVFHRYLRKADSPYFQWSWIGHRTAAAPWPASGWSQEERLFVGTAYDGSYQPGVPGPSLKLDSTFHPDLANCIVPTEPGVLVHADGTYLSLTCASVDPTKFKTVLLKQSRSTGSWTYRGSLLLASDASAVGYRNYASTELIETKNGIFLLTSIEDASSYYRGCHLFKITDLETASVMRESGLPKSLLFVEGTKGLFNGACGYDPSVKSGVFYHEYDFTQPKPFSIYMSFQGTSSF